MVLFPNCKINIGLQVLGKRADGFHDLQTIFYPINVKDGLEIIDNKQGNEIIFSTSGPAIEGVTENNLCLKAYHLLKKDFPSLPPIIMHLHKAIPMGAGLGGGSADAAFTLQLLNQKFSLGLDINELKKYALELGSDCPFFLINKPCFAYGRGEMLEEIALDLSSYKILIVNPGIHISTKWAFASIISGKTNVNIKELVTLPVNEWSGKISNDFETPVFKAYPEIVSIKDKLAAYGAIYCSMSGSGSSVYGIFDKYEGVIPDFPGHYFWKWA